MKIAIDIDDTIVNTMDVIIKYANIFQAENGRSVVDLNQINQITTSFYLEELFSWDYETKSAFFNKYYKIILGEVEEIPGASKNIKKLKENGYKIYFVTARITRITGCDTEKITEKCLKNLGIYYDKLIINAREKISVFKEYNIDVCIDDRIDVCKGANNIGIKAILKNTIINKTYDDKSIIRAYNWDEIYNIIKNF